MAARALSPQPTDQYTLRHIREAIDHLESLPHLAFEDGTTINLDQWDDEVSANCPIGSISYNSEQGFWSFLPVMA